LAIAARRYGASFVELPRPTKPPALRSAKQPSQLRVRSSLPKRAPTPRCSAPRRSPLNSKRLRSRRRSASARRRTADLGLRAKRRGRPSPGVSERDVAEGAEWKREASASRFAPSLDPSLRWTFTWKSPREEEGEERMMGLEPTTFCMASRRSSQLSYIRVAPASIARLR
jgi:hypothetical protein